MIRCERSKLNTCQIRDVRACAPESSERRGVEDASSGDVANVVLRLVSGMVSAPSIIRRQLPHASPCHVRMDVYYVHVT